MKKIISNKNISFTGSILQFILVVLILASCNPTKYVPRDSSLLDEVKVTVNREGIKKADLVPFIKQKPNKRIFGARFHLGLYNFSNINKDKWPHNWLREIGEEPVIFDQYSAEKSKEQIQSYIASKGYFDGRVTETVETANQQSKVYYDVELKPPYTIRNLIYEIEDTIIRSWVYFDTVSCLIERGKPYDVDVLQAEQKRLVRYIKDRGYYGFSGDNIFFNVDSTVGKRQVDIYYRIKDAMQVDANSRITYVPHSVYNVRNIYIYPNYVPKDALEGGEEYLRHLDTVNYKGYYFIQADNRPELKFDLIIQSLYLKPGSRYNGTNTEQSQSHLLALKTFRLVNIYYNEVPEKKTGQGTDKTLDCYIQLTLLSQQSFKVELEGTNSSGNLGGALNLIYQHKNLFHGAELFDLKLKGAYEAISQQNTNLRSTQEYGIETSLRLPKFLIPFITTEGFIKKYNPSTNLLAAYDYQDMPFYTRTMANATFGYKWEGNAYKTHIVNPVQFNIVDLLSIDSAFQARIEKSSYLAYSYRDVMILGGNYSYIYTDQKIKRSRHTFLRINAEASGNLLNVMSKLTGARKTDGSYNFFGQPFAQYVRADVDLRYNVTLNPASSVVYRGFVGAGIPYGNSKAIPFEKQYFGGGANGVRAWQVRTLGPGSYAADDSQFLNQTADIKIEANVEYRFKLFWILESALFLDAGNIWTVNYDPARPGSQFQIKNFYKDLAIGTGTGFRFDFSFVLLRADLGMKLRDPFISSGSRWIILNRPYNFKNDFTIVVAIGYPF